MGYWCIGVLVYWCIMSTPSIASLFLDKVLVGKQHHETSMQVFGTNSYDEDFEQNSPVNNSINDGNIIYLKIINIPDTLLEIILFTGEESRELSGIGGYTIMSISEIIRHSSVDSTFTDFGTCWLGMGHICVVSWRHSDGMCFIRRSGGANGYEQDYNNVVSNSLNADTGEYEAIKYKNYTYEKYTVKNKTRMEIFTADEFFSSIMYTSEMDVFERYSNSLNTTDTHQFD